MLKTDARTRASRILRAWRRDSNCFVFTALIVLSLVFTAWAVPYGIVLPSNNSGLWHDPTSPRFIPYMSGLAVFILSLTGLIRSLPKDEPASDARAISSLFAIREITALIVLVLSLPLATFVGLPIAGGIVGLGLLLLARCRRALYYSIVGAVMPLLIWAFFDQILNVPIPIGLF